MKRQIEEILICHIVRLRRNNLAIINHFVAAPWTVSNISPAKLFFTVDSPLLSIVQRVQKREV